MPAVLFSVTPRRVRVAMLRKIIRHKTQDIRHKTQDIRHKTQGKRHKTQNTRQNRKIERSRDREIENQEERSQRGSSTNSAGPSSEVIRSSALLSARGTASGIGVLSHGGTISSLTGRSRRHTILTNRVSVHAGSTGIRGTNRLSRCG